MKRLLLGFGTVLFALSLSATAQMRGGQGPHAWGDKDKDGKCDMTGQSVGQGRGRGPATMRQGNGRRGRVQQNGCCRRGQGTAAQPNSTPAPTPEPKK